MRNLKMLALLPLMAMVPAAAMAEHPGYPNPGPIPPAYGIDVRAVNQLVSETQQLNGQVQYSRLNYAVKDEVSRLYTQSLQLQQCAVPRQPGYPPQPYDPYNPYPPQPVYPPANNGCQFQLNQVMNTFDRVERYLADTYYDEPNVYRQYLETREAIDLVRNGGYQPPTNPYPQRLQAVGVMDTLRFQFAGERRPDIRMQCLQFARSYRLGGIRELVVNGQRYSSGGYGNLIPIQEACRVVAQNAR